jgi:predicted secreted protein
MSTPGLILTYVMIWCVVLFMVLPFGVRSDPDAAPGSDPGAPRRAHIGKKFAATAGIATVLWAAVAWLVGSSLIDLDMFR